MKHLGISVAMRVGQPPGKLARKSPGCLGEIQNFSMKVPLPLPMPTLLKSPQGPGTVVTQIYFKGLEHIFQTKSNARPDTENRRGPEPWF